jgi:hypothetical protein
MGNFMTKMLTDDMKKIIHCSNIHSACDPSGQNLQMDFCLSTSWGGLYGCYDCHRQ